MPQTKNGGPPRERPASDAHRAPTWKESARQDSGSGRHGLSEFGRAVLAAAAERDPRLVAELGVDMVEIRDFADALEPDAYDRLLVDAIRWRRLHSDSSHAISAALDWRQQAGHPSHAELERRRAVPRTRPCSVPGCGDTSGREHSHQPERQEEVA